MAVERVNPFIESHLQRRVKRLRAASVGFALYLIDAKTGFRFWGGAFDETQQALTDDVVDGFKQLGMGLRWPSAEALARHGIKSVLRKFKLN